MSLLSNQFAPLLETLTEDQKKLFLAAESGLITTGHALIADLEEASKRVIGYFFTELDKRLPLTLDAPFLKGSVTIKSPPKIIKT